MNALIYAALLLVGRSWMAAMDPDECGIDFSDEVRDILRRKESWERWSHAISQREDIMRERMDAWSNYRKTLENYSTSNSQELRSFAETMGNYYEEQVRRLVEKREIRQEVRQEENSTKMTSIKSDYTSNELRERLSQWQEYRRTINNFSEESTTQIKKVVDQITQNLSKEIMKKEMNEESQQVFKQERKEERKEVKQEAKEERRVEAPPTPPTPRPAPFVPSPPAAPPTKSEAEKKYDRIEASSYKFMSKLLDLVDYSFKRSSQISSVNWSEESRTTQEFYQAFTELRQDLSSTEVSRLDSVKTLSDKIIMCARLGRTDFQSLATVNDELSKFKNNWKFSSKSQAASQWASDWMMRMDLTMKKSMGRQSQISGHSSNSQKQFFDMRKSSSEHSSVISWSLMRSEELLSTAETTGRVDMDSVKAIVKSSMKISDTQNSDTSSWLHQVDESTNSSSMWTSMDKAFWSESSFEQVQSQKSSFSTSAESLSTISTM